MHFLKQFSKAVHHCGFVLQKRVCVAIESNNRVFVSKNFGQSFDIHSTLQRTSCKRMAKRVKTPMPNIEFFEQKFKTTLIRAYADGIAVLRNHKL